MKLFLDTANIDEIKEMADLGFIDGVTTNPSLIAKEGRDLKTVIKEICELVDGPISAEVIATDYDGIVSEAKALAELHPNIVVKVPLIETALKAVKFLTPKGIKFNVTLCFSLGQALLAAKAGAYFISPFVGRLDDMDIDGFELIPDMVRMYDNYGFDTQVLVASIRNPLHVTNSALVGADIATVPTKVMKQLVKHPLTNIGLEKFLSDYKKTQ